MFFSFGITTAFRFLPILSLYAILFPRHQSLTTNHFVPALEDSVVVDQTFVMKIPCVYVHNEQLEAGLKKTNDKLRYMAVVVLDGQSKPLSVSRYTSAESKTIQQAFRENETYHPPNSEAYYKILERGEINKEGRTLRYKVTAVTFESGEKSNSIIYYFMKDDAAKDLYELKLVCEPKGLDTAKALAEKIALSVKFR